MKTKQAPVAYTRSPYPADKIQPGDTLVLDRGRGPHTDDQVCTVTKVSRITNLWGDAEPFVEVEEPNGDKFHVGSWLFSGLPPAGNQ